VPQAVEPPYPEHLLWEGTEKCAGLEVGSGSARRFHLRGQQDEGEQKYRCMASYAEVEDAEVETASRMAQGKGHATPHGRAQHCRGQRLGRRRGQMSSVAGRETGSARDRGTRWRTPAWGAGQSRAACPSSWCWEAPWAAGGECTPFRTGTAGARMAAAVPSACSEASCCWSS